ncbi:MAG TPA: succinate dehydrogenase, cytochrome b556 subunit [Blastocatellia bacterium]|nr:succinate dehydrogenase, cytochrome b556 subunit [Blastocatellia bacterium]
MYKGHEGMWSWIFHRISGLAVLLFLFAHIVDTALIGWGPDVYNAAMALYRHPVFRVGEVLLVGAVVYHALNGIRIIVVDFWPLGTRFQRQMFWVEIVIFLILWIPASLLMLSPVVLGR